MLATGMARRGQSITDAMRPVTAKETIKAAVCPRRPPA